ncbi:MAG TPA: hypothetical protein VNQ55_10780 [Parapedobacter sp.]|nr:hypothetical protein [Parapedobacter sp.]
MAIQSCGQGKERVETNGNEPVYRLMVKSSLSYTIQINGITTASKNQNAGNERWFLINNCIPASGMQDLEITILPAMASDGMNHNAFLGNVGDDHVFSLAIERTEGNGPKEVFQYELPEGDYSRQAAFVHKATFAAEVPYSLEDWRKGETFENADSVTLKAAVLEFYNQLKHHYEHRNGAAYVKLIEKGMHNLTQGAYYERDAFEKLKQNKIDFIDKQPRMLLDIDSCRLEISANGKLLSLRRTDGYNRGEGVLRRKYIKNGQETVQVDDIWLFVPQGNNNLENGAVFEVVGYQNLVKPYAP